MTRRRVLSRSTKLVFLTVLAAFLPIAAWAQNLIGSSLDDRTEQLREAAESLYLSGDDQGAEALFLELAALDSTTDQHRAEALTTAAWLQHLRRHEAEAIASLESAFERLPTLDIDSGRFDERFIELAKKARRQVEERRSVRARSVLREGKSLLDQENLVRARSSFEEVLLIADDGALMARANYFLGVTEMRAGNAEAALRRFGTVLQIDLPPTSQGLQAATHSNLGTIHFRQGDFAEAEAAWRKAVSLDPEALTAWKNIGLVRSERGDEQGSLQAFRTAYGLNPQDEQGIRHLARALQKTAGSPEAIAVLDAGLVHHPASPGLWLEKGTALRSTDRGSDAAVAFEKAVALDPQNKAGVAIRGAVFLSLLATQEERFFDAERWARFALAWDDTAPEYWDYLGGALRAQGKYEEALAALDQSLQIDSTRAATLASAGVVLAELHRFSDAASAFESALAIDATNTVAAEGLVQIQSFLAEPPAMPAASRAPLRNDTDRATKAPSSVPPRKLGIRFAALDYDRLGLRGALVREVEKRSPAARTGLRHGDLVLRIDGSEILDDKDFFSYLKRNPPTQGQAIEVLRNASLQTLSLKLR
jgi:superkiller protein 3